jgi:hypothetical protein
MERRRDVNPWAFALLEEDNDAFRGFAYSTHEAAYVGCGICGLSIYDETMIGLTPDFTDSVFSGKGIEQILEVLASCIVDPGFWVPYFPSIPPILDPNPFGS